VDPRVLSAIIASAVALLSAACCTPIVTLLGVVAGAVATYRSASSQHEMELEKFYTEKWWEKKDEAYSHIIEQLARLRYYYGRWLDSLETGRDFTDEERKRLGKEHNQAKEEIERAAAAGAYAISDEASSALEEFLRALDRAYSPDFYAQVDQEYGLTKQCIATIRECASADLQEKQA
jgi:hypothetical protein